MKKEPVTPLKEKLISFETAKLAKEKGFELNSICYYQLYSEGQLRYKLFTEDDENGGYVNEDSLNRIAVVTQTLLQKWLREVHNCFIDILPHRDGDSKNKQWKNKEDVFWTVDVDYYGKNFEIELTDDSDFTQHFNNSYEEALEIGLQEALKLIENE